MSFLFRSFFLILSFTCFCTAQDPVTVIRTGWERTVQRGQPAGTGDTGPARAVTSNDKNFSRNARSQRTDARDPNEGTVDSRSAALEQVSQESRKPKTDDAVKYAYTAAIRNNSGKMVEVIFWEYRFTESAHPEKVVRRQFLCAVKVKDGSEKELSAFSPFGPSEVVGVESLAKPDGKMFDEKVIINRIEFADGAIIQRNNWKYEDVQKDVKRVTSTPWGKDVCRAL